MQLYTIEKIIDIYDRLKDDILDLADDNKFMRGLLFIIYHIVVIGLPTLILFSIYDSYSYIGLGVVLGIWIAIELITHLGDII